MQAEEGGGRCIEKVWRGRKVRREEQRQKEQRQDLSFNPFSHHAAWPATVPIFKSTFNTFPALKHLSVCVFDHMPFSTAASRVAPGLAQSGSTQERWFTLWCACLHMCMCVRDDKDSLVCSQLLRHFMVNPDHTRTRTHTHHSNPDNSSLGSRRGLLGAVCVLIEVLSHDALTAFPQPSLNLVTSVALLWLSPQWLLPVNLPGCQGHKGRLKQPLTSEAATKRPETSKVGSSVNRPGTRIYSARLK